MSLSARPWLSAFVLLGSLLSAVQSPRLLSAQAVHPQADRIAAHASLRPTTRLAGPMPAWAVAANDLGPAPSNIPLRLTFVLSRSLERQAAFTQLLADQQNPASASYHHWLTPQQIGTLYGPTQNDLNTLTSWLTSQGLAVKEIAPSHTFVTVEAPLSTVANALGVSFHSFTLHNASSSQLSGAVRPRLAATSAPAIPTALTAIVTSILGLADSPITPDFHLQPTSLISTSPVHPRVTSSNGSHNVMPSDFSVIYNLNPVYNSGIDGTGQKIAIIGRSQVLPADITNLEDFTGIAKGKLPNVIIPPSGIDPGMTGTNPSSSTNPDDQAEATIDVGRAFATAPGAQVDLVVSGTVGAMNGLYIAAMHQVQAVRDPVMNISFSSCEANDSDTIRGVSGFWNTLFSQAAAQGISVIVSSGDAGAAKCETAGQPPSATPVRSISTLCASGYATCVGGTQFADTASPSTYWSATNGTNFVSALSYIPEGAWNESDAASPAVALGTGGGVSTLIPKPSWQTGPGVPADNFRDVPDVSFSSSLHDGYVACITYLGRDCSTSSSGINAYLVAGTSAAAPAMAAIASLLNQKTGGLAGNLNPLLYGLAATTPSVFHDATPATSGVACDLNVPSICNNSIPGLAGYALTPGYDQATGLGSLDVAAFLSSSASAASISLSAATPSLTVQRGDSPTDLLTVSSFAYTGNASLSCAVAFNGPGNADSLPLCSLAPATVGLTGSSTATSTLTLATSTPPTVALAPASSNPVALPAPPHAPLGRIALGSLFLLALLPAKRYRHHLRGWHALPSLLLLFTGLGALSACSGSSTPLSPNPLLMSVSKTLLSSAASGVFAGGSTTFSASVSNDPDYGFNTTVTPTGTVQFFESGTTAPIGAATLVNGVATSTPISFSTPGDYTITAVYSGDNSFASSTSGGIPFSVQRRGTTLGSYTVTVNAKGLQGVAASTSIALTVQ